MANFCTNCGNPVKANWQFCPFCSNHIYHILDEKTGKNANIETYRMTESQSLELERFKAVKSDKKSFTKLQKKAIVIGVIVIIAAVITPIAAIVISQYLSPQRTVYFYVNNGNISTSYTVSTSRDILDYFNAEPHPSHTHWDADYVASVIESYCTPNYSKIVQIAESIQSKCIDQNDSEEIVNALLSFTQAIGYKAELIDLTKYPMETLFNQGDCEDLSVLFGSLVVALGYEAILVVLNYYDIVEEEWFGHACVGVYLDFTPTEHSSYPPSYSFTVNSKEYWICETTSQGWMVGQLPTLNPSHYIMEAYAYIN